MTRPVESWGDLGPGESGPVPCDHEVAVSECGCGDRGEKAKGERGVRCDSPGRGRYVFGSESCGHRPWDQALVCGLGGSVRQLGEERWTSVCVCARDRKSVV